MSTQEDRELDAHNDRILDDQAAQCHGQPMWSCAGCQRPLCDFCDGINNGSGLCWSCYSAAPDHETGDAA